MTTTQRILVFGGTFDPPHLAHVQLPRQAARELGCDRIIYIPTATSPFKMDSPPTCSKHRLAMLKLALDDMPDVEISTIELDRGGASYFADTIQTLREQLDKETELHFLMGCDQALEFDKWKDWRRILELATPSVMLRPPWHEHSFRKAMNRQLDPKTATYWLARIVPTPMLDINATDIRNRIAENEEPGDGLDPAVADYIAEHKLYRGDG